MENLRELQVANDKIVAQRSYLQELQEKLKIEEFANKALRESLDKADRKLAKSGHWEQNSDKTTKMLKEYEEITAKERENSAAYKWKRYVLNKALNLTYWGES